MIRPAIFDDPNSTDGHLFVHPVIQQNDAIGNVLLQAMTGVRVLSRLAGNDGRDFFLLQPSEKSLDLQAKNAGIGEARKERFNGIQNDAFGTNGINGMVQTNEQSLKIKVALLNISAIQNNMFQPNLLL